MASSPGFVYALFLDCRGAGNLGLLTTLLQTESRPLRPVSLPSDIGVKHATYTNSLAHSSIGTPSPTAATAANQNRAPNNKQMLFEIWSGH